MKYWTLIAVLPVCIDLVGAQASSSSTPPSTTTAPPAPPATSTTATVTPTTTSAPPTTTTTSTSTTAPPTTSVSSSVTTIVTTSGGTTRTTKSTTFVTVTAEPTPSNEPSTTDTTTPEQQRDLDTKKFWTIAGIVLGVIFGLALCCLIYNKSQSYFGKKKNDTITLKPNPEPEVKPNAYPLFADEHPSQHQMQTQQYANGSVVNQQQYANGSVVNQGYGYQQSEIGYANDPRYAPQQQQYLVQEYAGSNVGGYSPYPPQPQQHVYSGNSNLGVQNVEYYDVDTYSQAQAQRPRQPSNFR